MFGVNSVPSFLLLVVAVIVFASQAEGILNCQSTYSIEAAYKSCLHVHDIDFKVMDHNSASLEDALVSEHADTFCSYPKESYMAAMECIGNVTRQCTPEIYKFLLPLPAQWGNMASRICNHIGELDLECASKQSQANKVCGERLAHEYFDQKETPSKSEVQCWTFETEFDCLLDTYMSCNCKTAKVYSDLVLDIMMPSSCEQKELLEHRRLHCPADQNSIRTTTPLPALPDHVTADCRSVTQLKKGVIECFTNEEIHDQALFNTFVNSASPPQSLIETLFLDYGESACSSHRLRYNEAFKCTLQLLRDCTPEVYKQYLPSPDTAEAQIGALCDHREDIDFLCASKKVAALTACGKRKAMNYGSSTNGLLCFAYKMEYECLQEVYKSCGCMTAKVYSDMSLDLRYPKTCPREELESKRLSCRSSTSQVVVDMKPTDTEVTYYTDSSECMESRRQEIRKCYTNRGFDYVADGRPDSAHIFYGSILDTIMSVNDVCSSRKIRSARAAVLCEAEIINYCLPPASKTIFPEPEKLIQVLDSLCLNKDADIDSSCAYGQLGKIYHCQRSSANYDFSDVQHNLRGHCRDYRLLGDCAKDVLLTCGCPVAQTYSDTILNVMLPYECRSSDDSPQYMKCHVDNPYKYTHREENGNGAGRPLSALWCLAIALCLTRLLGNFL